jgi:hypothetical protein
MTIEICKCCKRTDKKSDISVLLNKQHKKQASSSLTLTSCCHLWIYGCANIEKATIMRKKKHLPTPAIKEENCDQEIKIKHVWKSWKINRRHDGWTKECREKIKLNLFNFKRKWHISYPSIYTIDL